ncbi:MAG: branched-chain amino acid ABC transporter permease, partial [Oscillospiraceae bacterium]
MKNLKKSTKSNLVTYAILIIGFILMTYMSLTGGASRQLKSLLVPICVNIILAVSLNLVIGFLGELSLGHAGFMSVGAYAGCLFSIYLKDILP